MPKTPTWHVTPHTDDGWQVKRETAKQPASKHDTKNEALNAAKTIARNQPAAHITVHKKNGKIHRQMSFNTNES